MRKSLLIILSLILIVLAGCKPKGRTADTSKIDLNIKIHRFDQAFWNLDTTQTTNALTALESDYPELLPIYLEEVLQFGKVDAPLTATTYNLFRKDTSVVHIYEDALKAYSDVSDIEQILTEGFKRGLVFFPALQIPEINMHVSGFNQSVIVGKSFISLSIDNYMGPDYPVYSYVNIYKYLLQNMCREKIPSDYLTVWITSEFPFKQINGTLLDEMLYRGKIIYVITQLLPDSPQHLAIGYTKQQLAWCDNNIKEMWLSLVTTKDLFSKDPILRVKYLNDAPFTAPFSQESPGRAGQYLGWKIIESYMNTHPEVTMLQLMEHENYQAILEQSGFKP